MEGVICTGFNFFLNTVKLSNSVCSFLGATFESWLVVVIWQWLLQIDLYLTLSSWITEHYTFFFHFTDVGMEFRQYGLLKLDWFYVEFNRFETILEPLQVVHGIHRVNALCLNQRTNVPEYQVAPSVNSPRCIIKSRTFGLGILRSLAGWFNKHHSGFCLFGIGTRYMVLYYILCVLF